MEDKLTGIELQIETIVEQIRSLNDEIVRLKSGRNSLLDEIVELKNGRTYSPTVRELLVDNYKLLEPIRLAYDILHFLNRHKIIRFIVIIFNMIIAGSFVGYALTGKAFFQIIGILK